MPTLKEFVQGFMEANNIDKDVDAMCKHITAEARKIQKNGCAVLDEDQVEKIILGAKLEAPKPEPKKVEPVKEEPKPKPKKEEKKDEDQLNLFDFLGAE